MGHFNYFIFRRYIISRATEQIETDTALYAVLYLNFY
jgi:hypothetical protein